MVITIIPFDLSPIRTISKLVMPGFECFALEDCDRMLYQTMTIQEISKIKVYGQTAIPYGKYEIVINYSNRFKKMLPLLLDVPGFTGIRIHPLNTAAQSHGCIGPGMTHVGDEIRRSREAMSKVMSLIQRALKSEKVWLERVEK